MKIVVICWLHTGDPDVQESQSAKHVRRRSITEATVLVDQ